jgi:hypothetical protein|tara:strand:+ start:52 stop:474 length:423 start_codon:yes stop_codon:yes gene_type:complete
MKAGHYFRWAEKSFEILNKFHSRMYELGGEESDLWSDDLNCRQADLDRALEDDNYDRTGYWRQGYFYRLEATDSSIQACDPHIKRLQAEIKELQRQVKQTRARKESLKKHRLDMIKEFDMDYKTIYKRLCEEFPEFIPVD